MNEDSVVSVEISCKPKMENLSLAKSEIDDYFSENPILGISDVDDFKSCLSKIRELRVKFKKSMFEVKSDMGEDEFVAMCPFCKELLNQASDYIIQANADDLGEKIRLAEITRADEREKKANDLAEKIRLEEIIRAEKLRKEDLELAEKVRIECKERDEKVRKKLEEKEDAEKVAAAKLCLDANQSSEVLAMQNRRIYACQAFSEIKERLTGASSTDQGFGRYLKGQSFG